MVRTWERHRPRIGEMIDSVFFLFESGLHIKQAGRGDASPGLRTYCELRSELYFGATGWVARIIAKTCLK